MWLRYVDDIFVIFEKETDGTRILEELNIADETIKFTLKVEKSNVINYLDIKITKTEDF